MSSFNRFALAAAVVLCTPLLSPPVQAGAIESACLRSDRAAASRALCNCIGFVADQLLTRGEQRQAARFFQEPHKAQEVRMSGRRSDEVFWERYKQFGSVASQRCG